MATASVWKDEEMKETLPCQEFSEFKVSLSTKISPGHFSMQWPVRSQIMRTSTQEALQQMRAVDDKIIYRLNTSVPTISFADQVSASDECKHLYEQVLFLLQNRRT